MAARTQRMTEGPLVPQMLNFMWPLLAMGLLNLAYNYADSLILGRFAGPKAFGAVEATTNLLFLFTGAWQGLCSGAAVLAARSFGAGRGRDVRRLAGGYLLASLLWGGTMAVLGGLFCSALIGFINVPADMIDHASGYLRVIFVGGIFLMPLNLGYTMLSALGDTRRPFYYLLCTNLLNIPLSLYFVAMAGMGAQGAALGTVISQAIGAALSLRALFNLPRKYAPRLHHLKITPQFWQGVKMGLPLMLQGLVYPFSNIIVRRQLNTFGSLTVAAFALQNLIVRVLWMIDNCFYQTASTFLSQNFGAKNAERLKGGIRTCLLLWATVMVPLGLFIWFFADTIGHLLVPDVAVVTATTSMLRRFFVPWQVLAETSTPLKACLLASGRSRLTASLTLICDCGIKACWGAFIFPLMPTLDFLLLGYPLGWLGNALAVIVAYHLLKLKIYGSLKDRSLSAKW